MNEILTSGWWCLVFVIVALSGTVETTKWRFQGAIVRWLLESGKRTASLWNKNQEQIPKVDSDSKDVKNIGDEGESE